MHDQRVGAGRDHSARQHIERDLRILVVDADAALDGDGNLDRALHRRNAIGDQRRLRHQAGAEAAVLHPVGRTADIEIDFVVAEILADLSRGGEIARVGTAELKRDRMLARIEAKQPRAVAMDDGAGRQHLRVEPAPPRHQTVEDAAMPVGPIHHRRNGKAIVLIFQLVILSHQWTGAETSAHVCTPNQPEMHPFVPHLISRCTRSAHEIGMECTRNADLYEAEVGELSRSGQEETRVRREHLHPTPLPERVGAKHITCSGPSWRR